MRGAQPSRARSARSSASRSRASGRATCTGSTPTSMRAKRERVLHELVDPVLQRRRAGSARRRAVRRGGDRGLQARRHRSRRQERAGRDRGHARSTAAGDGAAVYCSRLYLLSRRRTRAGRPHRVGAAGEPGDPDRLDRDARRVGDARRPTCRSRASSRTRRRRGRGRSLGRRRDAARAQPRSGCSRSSLAEMRAIRDHFAAAARDPGRARRRARRWPDRRRARMPGPDLERALQAQDLQRHDHAPRAGSASRRRSARCSRPTSGARRTRSTARSASATGRSWLVSVFHDNAGVVTFDERDPPGLQGRDAQLALGARSLRRRDDRHRRRQPRPVRHGASAPTSWSTSGATASPPVLRRRAAARAAPSAADPRRRARGRDRRRQPERHPVRPRLGALRRRASSASRSCSAARSARSRCASPAGPASTRKRAAGRPDRDDRRPHRHRRDPRRDLLLGGARRVRAGPGGADRRSDHAEADVRLPARGARCRAVRAITDNGAGGLSSSVGEMARGPGGARLDLAHAPLKYAGLAPWEILVSEAQERMTLAVPPEQVERAARARARGARSRRRSSATFTAERRASTSRTASETVALLVDGVPARRRAATSTWSRAGPRPLRRAPRALADRRRTHRPGAARAPRPAQPLRRRGERAGTTTTRSRG